MIRVMLVDDQELLRAGLAKLLEGAGDMQVIADTGDGERALSLALEHRPDVAIVDMAMPSTSGVELTRRLRRACPDIAVLAMSVHEDGPFPACALEMGAQGYITTSSSSGELFRAVRKVVEHKRYMSPQVAQNLVLNGNESRVAKLAPRELEVMLMLSEGRSLQQISDRLCVSPKTVSTYRTRLMRKLGTSSNVELAHVAFRHGLIQPLAMP